MLPFWNILIDLFSASHVSHVDYINAIFLAEKTLYIAAIAYYCAVCTCVLFVYSQERGIGDDQRCHIWVLRHYIYYLMANMSNL